MSCEHKRIKSENCVISCLLCGKILPIDYLVARERIKAQEAEKQPKKPASDVQTGENPSEPVKAAETPEKCEKQKAPARGRKGGKK